MEWVADFGLERMAGFGPEWVVGFEWNRRQGLDRNEWWVWTGICKQESGDAMDDERRPPLRRLVAPGGKTHTEAQERLSGAILFRGLFDGGFQTSSAASERTPRMPIDPLSVDAQKERAFASPVQESSTTERNSPENTLPIECSQTLLPPERTHGLSMSDKASSTASRIRLVRARIAHSSS